MKKNVIDLFNEEIKKLGKIILPDPYTFDYYNRLFDRAIFVNDVIDDELIDWSMKIIQWNKEDKDIPMKDRRKIRVYINSDGGSVPAVMNFIDVMKMSKTPIITIAMGRCYSSGGLMLMAGSERYIMPHTTVLIHDGSTGAIGDVGKVMDSFEFTQKMEKQMKAYILNNTKISEELYKENYRKDWFLFADECIQHGIADKIVTNIEDVF